MSTTGVSGSYIPPDQLSIAPTQSDINAAQSAAPPPPPAPDDTADEAQAAAATAAFNSVIPAGVDQSV